MDGLARSMQRAAGGKPWENPCGSGHGRSHNSRVARVSEAHPGWEAPGPGCASLTRATWVLERRCAGHQRRSEEHTSELQSLMRISYAVFCLKKKKKK